MGQPVARQGDKSTGHGPCGPQTAVGASGSVFINNLGAHRVGDAWTPHCDHTGVLGAGSGSVFVNNLGLGRVGDPISCGGSVATGSDNVFAG
jgi:uncharacterized Zn-binding protein involved in type VI secretion